jgi:hypothetical protein
VNGDSDGLEISVPDEWRGGVFANHVLVIPTEDAITLDFVRVDPLASSSRVGIVVARVAATRRCMTDLAAALTNVLAESLRSELESDDNASD